MQHCNIRSLYNNLNLLFNDILNCLNDLQDKIAISETRLNSYLVSNIHPQQLVVWVSIKKE